MSTYSRHAGKYAYQGIAEAPAAPPREHEVKAEKYATRRRKVRSLASRAATEGERQAARAALDRIS